MKKFIFILLMIPLFASAQYIGFGSSLIYLELDAPEHEEETEYGTMRVYQDGYLYLYFMDGRVVRQESILYKKRWVRRTQKYLDSWREEDGWYYRGLSQCRIIDVEEYSIFECIKREDE